MKLSMVFWHLLLVVLLTSGGRVLFVTPVAAADNIPNDGTGGGWRAIELTKDAVTRLLTTLKKEYSYRATVKVRVCMFTFDKIYEQDFAAGTNFQYHGLACHVGSAAGAGLCLNQVHTYELCAMHDIRLYEQAGTVNATQVLKIDILDGQPPKDADDVINVNEKAVASTNPSPSSNSMSTTASSSLSNGSGSMEPTRSFSASSDVVEQTLIPATKQEHHQTSFAIPPASSQKLVALVRGLNWWSASPSGKSSAFHSRNPRPSFPNSPPTQDPTRRVLSLSASLQNERHEVWERSRLVLASGGQVREGVCGGYYPTPVTEEKTQLLERALANEANYRDDVTARVRVLEICWLSYHPVHGAFYSFEVLVTPVESISSDDGGGEEEESGGYCAWGSKRGMYAIKAFDPWDGTLQVSEIKFSPSGSD